jgi:predicted DNA-binding transcriptional regulator AlpA
MTTQLEAANAATSTANADPIKRFADGCRHIGIGRTTAYNLIRSGALEAPLKLGPRACGWRLSTLDAFLNSRPKVKGGDK